MKKNKLVISTFFIVLSCNNNNNNNNNNMENNWKLFKLNSGEEIYSIELNKKQYETIMKDSLKFKDISDNFHFTSLDSKVYQMPNGNILSSDDGYYTIFKNINDLKKLINDFSDSNGSEILNKLNPYGENFSNYSNNLADDIINVTNAVGNNDVDKLKAIDFFINTHIEYKSCKYLINYIALIGNMILKKYNGTWETELATDRETWNPYLKIEGKRYDLITYVYEDVILSDRSSLLLSYQSLCDIIEKDKQL
ncbi:hypothetical protein [Riemerella anatipestifer]|uniref:hypothetical protein n=1 Tax=Riemerella anatipestifer TaxID=34085 RepID=UPI002363D18C|nr:hypothetical protein [Riemerella anatipestifer]MDD1524991.1 hypothetical protein [Riemerella anatipestifer]